MNTANPICAGYGCETFTVNASVDSSVATTTISVCHQG